MNTLNQLADAIFTGFYRSMELITCYITFIANPANSNIHTCLCHQNLSQMLFLCDRIDAPLKTEKVEGPTTHLTFLDIVFVPVAMEASISSEHKASLLTAVQLIARKPWHWVICCIFVLHVTAWILWLLISLIQIMSLPFISFRYCVSGHWLQMLIYYQTPSVLS